MADLLLRAVDIDDTDGFDDLFNQGRRHLLLYNPTKHTLTTWSGIGPGMPEAVYHGRLASFRLPACTGDSLLEWIGKHTELFDELRPHFKGTKWNGHNHVGVWAEEAADIEERIQFALDEHATSGGFTRRWIADDWLNGDRQASIKEICDLADKGKDAAAIASEIIETYRNEARMDEDDVKRYVQRTLRHREESIADLAHDVRIELGVELDSEDVDDRVPDLEKRVRDAYLKNARVDAEAITAEIVKELRA